MGNRQIHGQTDKRRGEAADALRTIEVQFIFVECKKYWLFDSFGGVSKRLG